MESQYCSTELSEVLRNKLDNRVKEKALSWRVTSLKLFVTVGQSFYFKAEFEKPGARGLMESSLESLINEEIPAAYVQVLSSDDFSVRFFHRQGSIEFDHVFDIPAVEEKEEAKSSEEQQDDAHQRSTFSF
ncbi:MAG: hypothetical protein ACE365_06410 [Gammaproteobacteria bacterium]